MFMHLAAFEYLGEYRVRLQFNNGVARDVDLSAELYGEVFEPLRAIEQFRQLYLNPETGTLEWPTGADFAPEYLYDIGVPVATHGWQPQVMVAVT
jgi:hypothetical protein